MRKRILFFVLMVFVFFNCPAQIVQSPEQFLGYKIGTRFTRYHKIVEYFKAVAQAKPDMVKTEKYGETNEGRELMLAYIALPENLKKLDAIRKNNLRIAGLSKDKMAAVTDAAPAIVWLSYNVHGNEAASSEAAMLTLFALVDENNLQTKEWLKNTVVIIDPCINPDGRDRYVNWYNTAVGKNYNVDPQAREHQEPWPRGRTNHYNFDLNRDWAWQTQIETQQRLVKYNEWMPQVHVDYHEQGYNAPYYFAPASEPYHEVITQWQRDFQNLIGRNHAKYFDANGWLFFTKERFDLFYPSYGDTYPMYNGAIGMTFEQGGIDAGLGIKQSSGDTLTFVDRVTHHFTTSLSTIETSSKNAQRLIDEYKKFFDDNRNAKNDEYKTYIGTGKDANKIAAVKKLLDRNGIEYSNVSGKIKGYRYFTGKEEEAQLDENAIAVSMYQSRSSIAKVLFEQKSKLSDSATYDITAWSIPYVYGVEAYALKEKKDGIASTTAKEITVDNSSYGYLIPYTSLNSVQLLAYLLKNDVKVRYADNPFTYKNKNYDRGTLIVLKTSNAFDNWNALVKEAAQKFNVQVDAVLTGFMDKGADFGSPDVHLIHAPKIALITGDQVAAGDAGEVWNLFDQTFNYPITQILAADLGRLDIKKYSVLIFPDGNYQKFSDKTMIEKLKDFETGGGKIIAVQGAVAAFANNSEWGIKSKEDKTDAKENKDNKDDYATLKKFADRDRDFLSDFIPGAIYKVDVDNTHPLGFGYPNYYYTLKQDAAMYEFLKDGWNVGVLKKDNYVAGFSGFKVKNKLKDSVLFGVTENGSGSFVFFADNPIFRMFWENGKMLFGNAVFLVGE
ncbi:MAG TPA: M14 metallopeptidase family protein [Chitinophagaceae bacterium]|nr:M14 metallopeptidase family protein [Chitinophagaceae bacterium]